MFDFILANCDKPDGHSKVVSAIMLNMNFIATRESILR